MPALDDTRRAALAQFLANKNDPNALLSAALTISRSAAAPAPAATRTAAPPTVAAPTPAPKKPSPPRPAGKTLVIGDSLGVGTVPYLRKAGVLLEADVVGGRSSASGIEALRRKLATGTYGRIVLDLGTNDTSAAQLVASVRKAQRLAPGARIFIPTVNGPQAAAKNAALRQLPGVTLVNWAMASGGLLSPDGIHATGSGYAKRAAILKNRMGG